ncbi:MAG: hypothetical protein WB870_13815, partial [Gallionellaceae bacterium]
KSMPIVVIFMLDALSILVVVKPPLLWHSDAVLGSGRPFHYGGLRIYEVAIYLLPLEKIFGSSPDWRTNTNSNPEFPVSVKVNLCN